MKVAAAILAAGQGVRFGGDKTGLILGGKPVWRWSYDRFLAHPRVDSVFLVTAASRVSSTSVAFPNVTVIAGGATRGESSSLALAYAEGFGAETLLLHDAARPFVSADLISAVIDAVEEGDAAAPGAPVTDTIKEVVDGRVRTLPRANLVGMQTPQGARLDLLRRAYAAGVGDATDDMALIEALGVHPRIVPGESTNFKITTPEDFARARSVIGGETRTGFGYDIHPFSDDPSRPLWLGGVRFDGHSGLEGHSDADVLLHAVTDALLGAAGLGDIGVHFPNTDPRWKNQASSAFLRHAASLLAALGWQIVHVDATCVAETPKIMPRSDEIRSAISEALGIGPDRVSVKATTNERLGAIGRSEGIAAMAVATISGGPRPTL